MVRCRDTSSRSERRNEKEKEKISPDFGKRERERLTDSIVVEAVLSKEHLPKVLADLVPCLSSSYRVVNHRSAVREKRPFGTHLASLSYAQNRENRGCDQ